MEGSKSKNEQELAKKRNNLGTKSAGRFKGKIIGKESGKLKQIS